MISRNSEVELGRWNSVNFLKKIERSVSIIIGILGNLDHFRHFFYF